MPTAACSSSTSSASSAATRWRRCGRRWRRGWVSIARAGARRTPALPLHARRRRQSRAPAGAARPTPSAAARRWRCSATRARLSGALADRIDILAAIRQPSAEEIGGAPGEPSAAVRERVGRGPRAPGKPARRRALQRRDDARPRRASARSTEDAAALLAESYARRRLSGRAHDRVLRLARTIADLAGSGRDRARADRPGPAAAAEGRRVSCSPSACPDCLRRARLLARLAPYIETDRHRGGRARARRNCCASPTRTWSRPPRRRSPRRCWAGVEGEIEGAPPSRRAAGGLGAGPAAATTPSTRRVYATQPMRRER